MIVPIEHRQLQFVLSILLPSYGTKNTLLKYREQFEINTKDLFIVI